MEIINICPKCGEVMGEKEGYVECPSCGNRIGKGEVSVGEKKGFSFKRKLALCIILDALDLTVFRIPVLGSLYDAILIGVAVKLFGGLGFLESWELFFDLTDQIDAEIPTLTLLCLLQRASQSKFFKTRR